MQRGILGVEKRSTSPGQGLTRARRGSRPLPGFECPHIRQRWDSVIAENRGVPYYLEGGAKYTKIIERGARSPREGCKPHFPSNTNSRQLSLESEPVPDGQISRSLSSISVE